MANPFTLKLDHGAPLAQDDRDRLTDVCTRPYRLPAGTDIIREGQSPRDVHLVLDGIACRYKVTDDGQRRIVGLMIPGDLCDLNVMLLGEMDHSIGTLSACLLVDIPRTVVLELQGRPKIAQALTWAALVDEAVMREWLMGCGRRGSAGQMAHFFCEMLIRLQTVDRADGFSYALPLTQSDLGDLLGISAVHVNRTMSKLRLAGLVEFRSRRLRILDWDGLCAVGGFSANYLHLQDRPAISRVLPRARP